MSDERSRSGSGTTFSRRLGYYLVGVTIGLLALGWFQMNRGEAERAADAERAGENPAATTESAP
ncbi:MAG: hypothetical protein CMJ31_02285 [Phycisphaerae bacterium]|nr:hypothetical protein [Phycisphaerae bacterium]